MLLCCLCAQVVTDAHCVKKHQAKVGNFALASVLKETFCQLKVHVNKKAMRLSVLVFQRACRVSIIM
jgi:hypothetical protein